MSINVARTSLARIRLVYDVSLREYPDVIGFSRINGACACSVFLPPPPRRLGDEAGDPPAFSSNCSLSKEDGFQTSERKVTKEVILPRNKNSKKPVSQPLAELNDEKDETTSR